ncbi:tyrosine-type recombinase/integrase [Pseudonocardia xishanensis]|uniref:tyrosine-type recombinase/integrase n=1 Tax=Pseudonocardia xishanensis TaxID=630995 RepID=UPI0031EB74F1
MQLVEPPSRLPPDPDPPTVAEAVRLLDEAWLDPDWGTLVWFTMTTGLRRGELCGVRWSQVDLERGAVTINRAIARYDGVLVEKDTKSHQKRRLALDPQAIEILKEHRARAVERAASLGLTLRPDAFLFSLAPDNSTPMKPATVGQRSSRMAARVEIDTHLHCLRH